MQGRFHLLLAGMFQANKKRLENGLFLFQARANHERKSETLFILRVKISKLGDIRRTKVAQTGARLLSLGFLGEGRIADEIRMRPDQAELLIIARFHDRIAKRGIKIRAIGERAFTRRAGRNPRRMLEQRREQAREFMSILRVQFLNL